MSTSAEKPAKKSKESRRKSKADAQNDRSDVAMVKSEKAEAQPDSPDVASPQSSKKRKRNEDPVEELEIDVSLPEPLSRKEKRKAKKPKSEETSDVKDGEPNKSADGPVKDKSSKASSKDKEESKRSKWGIWIGNLPWSASKQDLKDFLITGAGITEESITRIHMPGPTYTKKVPGVPVVNQNKGFAYVDFDTEQHLNDVLLLTETQFSQNTRKVLIKNATSFAGRPEKTVDDTGTSADGLSANKANSQKPPSKRVFIGNLPFEITKDDLTEHYARCGPIADIHMATFEDSGKCKGYAWITFESLEGAEQAVRGWFWTEPESDPEESEAESSDDQDAKPAKKKKRGLNRKRVFVNRYAGRALRTEFAEDAGVRYKKRFGKDAQKNAASGEQADDIVEATAGADGAEDGKERRRNPDRKSRSTNFVQRYEENKRKLVGDVDLRKTSGAILASEGKRMTFDD